MHLQPTQQAPSFSINDIFGNTISLADYAGKKVLVSFYRYASCPLCNLRIHHLMERYQTYHDNGLSTIAFFQSPVDKIRQYVTARADIPFPIIADPDHHVYNAYGLECSWWGYVRGALSPPMVTAMRKGLMANDPDGIVNLLPADFLLWPDQTIHTAFYGTHIGEHIPFEQIDAFVHETPTEIRDEKERHVVA